MQPGISVDFKDSSNQPPVHHNGVWQHAIVIGATAIAYFLAARSSLFILNLGIEASPVWPPAGIALAALLWYGRWTAVGVALGAWLVNHTSGAFGLLSVGSILGSTLQAVIGAALLQRIRFCTSFARLYDVLGFVSLAVLVAPVINASIGTLMACLVGYISWSESAENWWTIWLGDGMGILIFTPSLLAARQWIHQKGSKFSGLNTRLTNATQQPACDPQSSLTQCLSSLVDRPSSLERWLWLGLLVAVSWLVFYSRPGESIAMYPLEYLPFPFVIWAALRFGQVKAILSSFVLSSIAVSGTILGRGPFIAKAVEPNQVILLLQAFIGVITITAMILASVMATRQQAEIQLRLTAERNRLLSEMAMRIRQSLDLHEILATTVSEVREFLQADRVFFSCIDASGRGEVLAESVAPGWNSIIGWVTPPAEYPEIQAIFEREPIRVVHDTAQAEASAWIRKYHDRYHVRAGVAVPILLNAEQPMLHKSSIAAAMFDHTSRELGSEVSEPYRSHSYLFGVLVVNQCSSPRQWQPLEVELLEQLGTQVAIALQQGQLYRQVQDLNANLEKQVMERTLQLRANMAELEELNRLRDVFIHAIAHDLRTTVMGTLMVLQNLQNQPGDKISVSRTLLERMTQSGDIQLCKLNSLLEAYKNKTEGIVINPESVDVAAMLRIITTSLKSLFDQNAVNLVNHIPDELPRVVADHNQLERVFRHLLVNAVKHNPPGVQITLEAAVKGDRLHCTVSDNGKGISQKQCSHLFELCMGTAQERQLTGISLGLFLCHQIITAHGGEIGVDSTPDQGSSFWFTLPLYGATRSG
ncbi:MAG: hypothetical protein Kow00121_28780 [Elainellaceae cyanobacterium]